ncbi:response regulator transcription factor [Streptomyces sp. H27-D2]|uniref:response regulator transcription factor n=1 Tax=Streptomyces sp. H27-D2 TaxID=3046304 RepID=UPI002DBE38B8|nr:response regulator transcription factor [Streptomyces sp. H27-D2]MEC4019153.1 response regulator transcription factor [Streptomyces sp. H27-D2]
MDNHPVVRYALTSLLKSRAAWTAEAASAEEAWNSIKTQPPDVIVLELEFDSGINGIELCRRVKTLQRAPRVLVFTGDSSPGAVVAAISAGTDSYLHKSVGYDEVVEAVEKTFLGQRLWVLDGKDGGPIDTRPVTNDVLTAMTRREEEVFGLVLRRYTNEEIAEELSLAHQTIKNQVSSVLRKLGVSGRRELFRKYSSQAGAPGQSGCSEQPSPFYGLPAAGG